MANRISNICAGIIAIWAFAASHHPAMTATIAAPKTVICPFCGGTGKLPHYSHIQNGDCFACGATGQLRDLNAFVGDQSDVMLTVWTHRSAFTGAELRQRTWKIHGQRKEWGRDGFYRRIEDVKEARAIWRNAKHLGIITELVD